MGRRTTDIRNWDSNKDKRSKNSKAASSARSRDMDKPAELDKPVPAGKASAWGGNGRVLGTERLGRVVRFNAHWGCDLERQQRLRFNNRRVSSSQEHANNASRRPGSSADGSTCAPISSCSNGRAETRRTRDRGGITFF